MRREVSKKKSNFAHEANNGVRAMNGFDQCNTVYIMQFLVVELTEFDFFQYEHSISLKISIE
jgi:hypothetical protein